MTVREQLIEILRKPIFPHELVDPTEAVADYLLDNGVTIPEWIPVTERLPEKNNQWVLCRCVGGAMEVLKFDFTMWNWDSQYPGRCYMESYVTHWMPLPQAPGKEGT